MDTERKHGKAPSDDAGLVAAEKERKGREHTRSVWREALAERRTNTEVRRVALPWNGSVPAWKVVRKRSLDMPWLVVR